MSRPEGVEPGLLQIHLGAEIASDPADALDPLAALVGGHPKGERRAGARCSVEVLIRH
jgi:hypothetical protein